MADSELVLGIDEAGRGPALGPMVLAAVALGPAAAERLLDLGVTDSKAFGSGDRGHARRLALLPHIERHATFVGIEICDVATIDAYVRRGHLNVLERERATALIRSAPPCARIVADGETLFAPLRATFLHLEAHNGGEAVHVAVAAASVCAKVRRDQLFACVNGRYAASLGPIGGAGYGQAAQAWVLRYTAAYGYLPPEARASWGWKQPSTQFRVGATPPRQLTLLESGISS